MSRLEIIFDSFMQNLAKLNRTAKLTTLNQLSFNRPLVVNLTDICNLILYIPEKCP